MALSVFGSVGQKGEFVGEREGVPSFPALPSEIAT